MTQRNVEMLIGRLVTDEEFRGEFFRRPLETLQELSDAGLDLSPAEVAALLKTDGSLWTQLVEQLDPRLQKASLKDGGGTTRGADDD